jgi:hypothetical protein
MEEGQLKMKLRIAQLDDWITEGKAFVADADRKIKELGDVFRMMMVTTARACSISLVVQFSLDYYSIGRFTVTVV